MTDINALYSQFCGCGQIYSKSSDVFPIMVGPSRVQKSSEATV